AGGAIVFAWPIARIVAFDVAQVRPTTRDAAVKWLLTHAGSEDRFCAEVFGLPDRMHTDPRITPLGPRWWRDPDRHLADRCLLVPNSFFAASFTCGGERGGDEGHSIEEQLGTWPVVAEFRALDSDFLSRSLERELNFHAPRVVVRRQPVSPPPAED